MIIGAYKCGTSFLHDNLDQHPDITMSIRKEPAYFSKTRNFDKGVQWYQSQWPRHNRIMGESSPQYTYASDWEEVPARMQKLIPDVKLILSIRDPIERIVSHYLHSYKKYDELRSFEEAVSSPTLASSFYVQCSRYYAIASRYLEKFERSQIHIIVLEQLKSSPAEEMKCIFQFLEIDDSFYLPSFTKPVNRTRDQKRKTLVGLQAEKLRKKIKLEKVPVPSRLKQLFKDSIATRPLVRPVFSAEFRNRLVEILEPDVSCLKKQLDLNLDLWNIV
jgi:hypothetical protein